MYSLPIQLYMVAVMLLSGIALGLAYDIYRVWRGLWRPAGYRAILGDLGFWLLATGILGFGLVVGNWGELRLYVFLGWAAGLSLYHSLVSRLVIKGLIRIAKRIARGKRRLTAGLVAAGVRWRDWLARFRPKKKE
ncbi:MAG: spore cortex biosynthesis protein YabQ [Bacillota bacterium]